MPIIRSHRAASASVVLAAALTPASAEHIELTVSLSTVPGDIVATLGGAVATVVFDTDEPPIESDLQSVTFGGVAGTLDAALYSVGENESPSIANADPVRLAGAIDSAMLTYSQAGNRNLSLTLTKGDATLTLTVFEPAGAFSPSMTSLPDDPGAYIVLDETDYVVFANVLTDDESIFASIDRSGSFLSTIGGVSYNARTVTAPQLPPCNAADLAAPFGQLDFDDVLAFLTAFAGMDLAADLAPPTCAFDFDDILAFLGAYGEGCP